MTLTAGSRLGPYEIGQIESAEASIREARRVLPEVTVEMVRRVLGAMAPDVDRRMMGALQRAGLP